MWVVCHCYCYCDCLYTRRTCELPRSPRVSASNRTYKMFAACANAGCRALLHMYQCQSYNISMHNSRTSKPLDALFCVLVINIATIVTIPGQVQVLCHSAVLV